MSETVAQQALRIIVQATHSVRAIRHGEILSKIDTTGYTLSKTLTQLKKSGYISESQGQYLATDKALEILKTDPKLNTLSFNLVSLTSKPKEVNGVDTILSLVDWDLVAKRTILARVTQEQDEWAEIPDMKEVILPFVLLYLIQSGVRLPIIEAQGNYTEEYSDKLNELFGVAKEMLAMLPNSVAE